MSAGMDKFLGAGGLGAAGSVANGLIGGIAGGIQARKNRKFIERQNQLGREFQAQQLREQQKFAEKMWNQNNEWNSAKSVKQRFLDAGMNPALMMMQGSMGSAQSTPAQAQGTPSAFSSDAMPYQNAPYITQAMQGITDFANNLGVRRAEVKEKEANASEANQKANQLAIQNLTEGAMREKQLRKMDADTGLINLNRDMMQKQIQNYQSRQDLEMAELNASIFKTTQEGIMQMMQNEKFPESFKSQMSLQAAQTIQALSSGELSRAEAQKTIAQSYGEWFSSAKQYIDMTYYGEEKQKLLRQLDDNHKKGLKEIDLLTKNDKWYTYDKVAPFVVKLAGGLVGGVAGAFVGGPAGAAYGAALGMGAGGAMVNIPTGNRTTVKGFSK